MEMPSYFLEVIKLPRLSKLPLPQKCHIITDTVNVNPYLVNNLGFP